MVITKAIKSHLENWGCETKMRGKSEGRYGRVCRVFTGSGSSGYRSALFNGYHWCTQIRAVSKVPIIFISSASDNMNIVMAMNMGGDDFISKPFDLNVLTAKIQALLRRTYDFSLQAGTLEHRGAVLNTGDATLSYEGEDRFNQE